MRGHFSRFKVSFSSLSLRSFFLQDSVSCLSKGGSGEPAIGEGEAEELSKETTQKVGTENRRECNRDCRPIDCGSYLIKGRGEKAAAAATAVGRSPLSTRTLRPGHPALIAAAAATIFQVSNSVDQTILKHFCGGVCLNSGGCARAPSAPFVSCAPPRRRIGLFFCPRRCDVNGFGGSFHESVGRGRSVVRSFGRMPKFPDHKTVFSPDVLLRSLYTLHTRRPTFSPRTLLCPQVVRPAVRRRLPFFLHFPSPQLSRLNSVVSPSLLFVVGRQCQ